MTSLLHLVFDALAAFVEGSAERGIDEMCADAWRWQSNNPNGYADA